MLLELFISEGQTRNPVSRLAKRSGVPKATALRWLDYLQAERLIDRDKHPTDARVSYVHLTDLGRRKIEAYLSETIVPLE
jgi:DNA-binding MarR family transcriptional regulator